MRKDFALSMIVMLIGASSACGPSNSNQGDGRTQAEKQQALRDSTFGSLAESMDRAREVEELQRDRKDRIDAAMDH